MPTVTSIKQQKNKKRLNIFLDYKYAFSVDLETFLKNGLKEGKEYNQEDVDALIKQSEFKKNLDKVLKFAMTRPRSEKEINDYFKRKKIPEVLQKDLFNQLNRFNLLNDLEFASWWINQRISSNRKSKKEIEFELLQKGIKRDTIVEVFSKINFNEYELAKKIMEKKISRWIGLDQKQRDFKLSRYLASKGFDWNVIDNVLKYLKEARDE